MTRSRLHGRTPALAWGFAAVAIGAALPALARQERAGGGDANGVGAVATPAPDRPAAGTPAGAVPSAGGAVQGGTTTMAPAAPPPPPAPPPDPTEGDRNALIREDVARHPPQLQIPSRDPSHLQTAKMKLGGLLDRSVRSLDNSEVGRVIDVMTGDDGRPAALELDVGGFLGVGNRKIAVSWDLFDLSRTGQNDPLRVALSAAQVRSAPAMDEAGETPVVTGAAPVGTEPDAAAQASEPGREAASPAPGSSGAAVPPAPQGFAPASPPPATPPDAPPSIPPGTSATDPAATASGTPPARQPARPADAAGATAPADRKPAAPPADTSRPASRVAPRPATTRHDDRDKAPPDGNGEQRF